MRAIVPFVLLALVACTQTNTPSPTPTVTVTVTPEPAPTVTVTATPDCPKPPVEYPARMPNELSTLQQIAAQHPGMLQNECAQFLREAVAVLQAKNPNWGYCNKPAKNKVPADILMYRASGQLVDYSISSCSSAATLGWQAMEPPSECIWGATADYPIPQ